MPVAQGSSDSWMLMACSCSQRVQAALQAFRTSPVDWCVVGSSPVLRVVVENLVYPVSLDALCQVSLQWVSPCMF